VIVGVDTHSETHHAAVMFGNGQRVDDREFPVTAKGYAALLAWARSFGRVDAVGVEGTGSYGAGLARFLAGEGVRVVEVARPDRRQRREQGKSDALDAYAAADAVAAGRARAVPKGGTGAVEALRGLHTSRAGAVKARTAAINELRAVLVTAPQGLRERFVGLGQRELIDTAARLRRAGDVVEQAVRTSLRSLARRYRQLSEEVTALDEHIQDLVALVCPQLLQMHGVGPETAAQLLITAGDNPIPASSGKVRRWRLSRGGDRQANRALYMIILSRLATDPGTRAYRQRRTEEGLSPREIIRCLKNYLARRIHKVLITCMNTIIPPTPQPALDKP
jgi:transposase